jgi:TetR/AcrR family transcriptional repressor of nem operon
MRKSKQDAAVTRQRIVELGSAEVRRSGISGMALTDLMALAGLTNGGFYKHFESKDHVVRESIELAVQSRIDAMDETLAAESGVRGLHAFISDYLSIEYRDNVAGGCPFVALGSEVARGSAAIRETTSEGFLDTVDRIAEHLSEPDPTVSRKSATVLLSTMIGAVTMARMVADETASAAILEGVRQHLTAAF